MEGIKTVKKFFSSKWAKVSTLVTVMCMSIVSSAMAAETTPTVDQATVDSMTGAFGNVKATALAALAGLAVIAIALFAGVYAWRYGKKVFSIIAK